MFGSSNNKLFDKLVEKATSPLQLEIDWNSIMQMCDVIRQGDVQPKYAMNALKKKLTNENINVLNYSLHCIESLVKNCGSKVHQEVTNKEFMDLMKSLAVTKPDPIKTKVLELIQCWAFAFRKNANYKIVEDYFNAMKLEGLQYPAFKESDSMFDVEQAPEWKDDTNCFRCRTEFTTFNRKHHCRCCGQIFCQTCSSKQSPIPKFGIEKEVRVCDPCFDKLKSNAASISNQLGGEEEEDPNALPIEYLSSPLSKQKQVTNAQAKTEEEFEEELQLALALSQSEQEEKDKKRNKFTPSSKNIIHQQQQNDESEAELNKFLARSAAKKAESTVKQITTGPSPPPSAPFVEQAKLSDDRAQEHNEETNQQMNLFIDEVKKFMEIFITRMKSDQLRGRTITNDTAVQSLFLQLQQLHPKLLAFIKFQEDARGYFESLQDKLTQLKDAREALNALRYENFEKKRREAEERERLKQLQLNSKLADMRQKKHLYFKQQTEQNLQKLQEQERDLKLRLEQQRYLVSIRDHQLVSGLQFTVNNQNQIQNPYEQQYINPMYSIGMSQGNLPQQPQFQQLQNNIPSFVPPNSMMQQQPQGMYMNQQNPYNNNNSMNAGTALNMPQQQQPIMNIPVAATPKPTNLNPEPLNNQIPYHSIQQQWQSSQQQLPMQTYQMNSSSIQQMQQQPLNQMNFNPQLQQQQYNSQIPAFKPQNEEVQLISFD